MQQAPLTHLSYHVLLVLAAEPLHGYGIVKAIERRSDGRLVPETGTLYTAIRRLQQEGLIEAAGAAGPGRRGARYRLTRDGRRALRAETERLRDLVAVARELRVLDPGAAGPGRR